MLRGKQRNKERMWKSSRIPELTEVDSGGYKMFQRFMAPALKAGDLNLITETHMGGENLLPQLILWYLEVHHRMHIPIQGQNK